LASYYEFYSTLFEVLNQARSEISGAPEPALGIDELMGDEETLQARLRQGLPLLSFAQLPLEEERFAELVSTVAQLLMDYDPDLAGQTVPDDPAECLALAQRRFEEGQAHREKGEASEEITLAQMSVDLALKPYLEWAAQQVLSRADHPFETLTTSQQWKRGYCPVCGGAPDFATLDDEVGARYLACSRCNSQWRYHRLGCPFCETTDHTKLVYYPSEDGVHRLYVCQDCQRYLKTIDLREVGRAVLLPVERVTTVAMDAAARQEGYR
jgi:FdhE protein